jgi:hypothetical protein
MSDTKTPGADPFDDGFIGSGRSPKTIGSPISDEDVRRLEEAWNDPAFYDFVKDDVGGVTAGYVPKTTVDPSLAIVPSEEEIQKLPQWAQVAFAARCAHRVLPITVVFWVHAPMRHLRALDRAVRVAETAAATTEVAFDDTAIAAADAAADSVALARDAANAVAHAASAVRAAGSGVTVGAVASVAASVARAACTSLLRVLNISTIRYLAAPARDLDLLRWLAETENWTDDSPVSQSVFGPMWEGTPPAWWTDDVLAGLPPEPAVELNKSGNQQAAPVEDATQPK